MNIKLKNIAISFVSDCCTKLNEQPIENGSTSSQTHAKIRPELRDYIMRDPSTKSATTITIGNKWIGKLSSRKQYIEFCKAIRKHIGKRDPVKKYLYVFELQDNGQLHAHGVEIGTWQASFIESFQHFGRRNVHDASFCRVKSIDKYLTYMDKEHAFPYITNIRSSDIKKMYSNNINTKNGRRKNLSLSTPQDSGEENTSSCIESTTKEEEESTQNESSATQDS